ncbi:MAG: pyridoxamine 5'-phosphate oxidase family protein [Cyclobacteriaceae bacterium]
MLTKEIKDSIESSVLCWLATSSKDNIPNVSPKEVFSHYLDNFIIVANIASPQTIKNIKENENTAISFIDIFIQKGFQLKGKAIIVKKGDAEFRDVEQVLLKITEGKFPFSSVIKIHIKKIKPIIAPKYLIYPETTEEQQIKSAKKTYGL